MLLHTSLLPLIATSLERIFYIQQSLFPHLLLITQHSFWANHSTQMGIVLSSVLHAFFDLSSVFDTVDYAILFKHTLNLPCVTMFSCFSSCLLDSSFVSHDAHPSLPSDEILGFIKTQS